ncbi:MAG: transporter [Thermoanaerobaculia bacterium]
MIDQGSHNSHRVGKESGAKVGVGRIIAVVMLSCCIFLTLTGPAFAASITFSTALPVTKGQGIVRVQWKVLEFGEDSSSLERDLTVRVVPVVGVWGLTRRLALFGIAPLFDKNLGLTTPLGRRTRSVSGLGDVTLLARYTAYQRDAPGKTLRIAPFLGVDVPTGEDNASDALGRLPQPLQLGSGAWDYNLGTIVTRQTLDWQIDASLSYKFNTVANDFEFGDEARFDFSYQKRLRPREIGRGVPAFLYGVLESNLIWQDRHEIGGSTDPDSGGVIWYLAPGIQHVRRRVVLEGAVQIPLLQNLHGAALETDFIATLSLRANF